VALSGTGAASDLEITDVIWSNSDPYVCDEISVDVTVTNSGNYTSSPCYLDLYYDPLVPPSIGEFGEKQILVGSIPAGGSTVVSILQVWNDIDETWNSYLQVDCDNSVIESNETNNIWGADQVVWDPLPTVNDLHVEVISGFIYLSWSFPISCDSYNVYKSIDPYDFSGASSESSSTNSYTEPLTEEKYFYLIKAVRDCIEPTLTGGN
jgi:hypothetical protein